MGEACGTNGGKRNASRVLVGKRELRTPHGKRGGVTDDTETDFWQADWQGVDWMNVAQKRAKWRCCCGNEPSGFIQCRQSWLTAVLSATRRGIHSNDDDDNETANPFIGDAERRCQLAPPASPPHTVQQSTSLTFVQLWHTDQTDRQTYSILCFGEAICLTPWRQNHQVTSKRWYASPDVTCHKPIRDNRKLPSASGVPTDIRQCDAVSS